MTQEYKQLAESSSKQPNPPNSMNPAILPTDVRQNNNKSQLLSV
jgi:hypothetical protein